MAEKFKGLLFEGGYDSRDESETPLRGYRSHVFIETNEGTRYQVTFFDPVRLTQELNDEVRDGKNYLTEPGLIVLPKVNLNNMENAAKNLFDQGLLSHLRPSLL